MTRWSIASTLVIGVASFAPLGVFAQDTSAAAEVDEPAVSSEEQEARTVFEAGQLAYDDARYDDALESFRRAHALSGRAQLLYNIGLCLDYLSRRREAIEAFESYLAAEPDAPNRRNVEARIRRARELLAREEEERASSGSGGGASSGSGVDEVVPLVVLGVGAAVAIAGGVLLGVGSADVGSIQSTPSGTRQWTDVESDLSRAQALQIAGGIGLGVGIAATVAGLVLWLARGPSGSSGAGTAAIEPGVVRF